MAKKVESSVFCGENPQQSLVFWAKRTFVQFSSVIWVTPCRLKRLNICFVRERRLAQLTAQPYEIKSLSFFRLIAEIYGSTLSHHKEIVSSCHMLSWPQLWRSRVRVQKYFFCRSLSADNGSMPQQTKQICLPNNISSGFIAWQNYTETTAY